MARNKLDKAWLARHLRDPYVRQASRQGYRSRAAFKLMELDDKDRLLRPGDRGVDLVLSDMSPNLSGVKATDAARAQALVEVAVSLAAMLLKPDGILVVKIFHGAGTEAVIRGMRAMFRGVAVRKPPASRARSSEIYAVCRGLLSR